MRPLRLAPILVLVLLATLAAAPAVAQLPLGNGHAAGVVVNLQFAEDHGCSDERESWFLFGREGPDLQVRVWHDGGLVHESSVVRETAKPEWRDYRELPAISRPATLSFQVREAEPNGTWYDCDLTPDAGNWLNVTINHGGVGIDARGESALAARLVAKVAPSDARRPVASALALEEATHSRIALRWQGGTNEIVTHQEIRSFWAKNQAVDARARSHAAEGLRSDWEHDFQLLREGDGWSVLGPAARFRTLPAPVQPPAAPTVTASAGYDEINVSWNSPDTPDVAIHVGREDGFTPGPETLHYEGHDRVPPNATIAPVPSNVPLYVRAVAWKQGVPSTPSEAVRVVAMPRPPPPTPANVSVTSEHDGLRVQWSPPTTAGVARHEIVAAGRTHEVAMPQNRTLVRGIEPGAHDITIRAVNANGLFADAKLRVTFAPPNEAPTLQARFAQERIRAGQTATLAFYAHDPDGDALQLHVDWGEGEPENAAGTTARRALHEPGERIVVVTAQDAFGAVARAQAHIVVVANEPPRAQLRVPANVFVGDEVLAESAGTSDPEGDALGFDYDWGDGAREPGGPTARHVYRAPGSYRVTLRVLDEFGAGAEATADVAVSARPPAPAAAPPERQAPPSATPAPATPATPAPADEWGAPTPDGFSPDESTTSAPPQGEDELARHLAEVAAAAPDEADGRDAPVAARDTPLPVLAGLAGLAGAAIARRRR